MKNVLVNIMNDHFANIPTYGQGVSVQNRVYAFRWILSERITFGVHMGVFNDSHVALTIQ